jgi:hypothetical protein
VDGLRIKEFHGGGLESGLENLLDGKEGLTVAGENGQAGFPCQRTRQEAQNSSGNDAEGAFGTDPEDAARGAKQLR